MKQQISAAFGHRQRPANATLVMVSSSLRRDAMELARKEWPQVTRADWVAHGDAFFGLSPEAFAYFLPSILMLSLDPTNLPLGAADALAMALDTSADPDIWNEWFLERFGLLTRAELGVLKHWSATYLAMGDRGEGSEFARVQETIGMLELSLVE